MMLYKGEDAYKDVEDINKSDNIACYKFSIPITKEEIKRFREKQRKEAIAEIVSSIIVLIGCIVVGYLFYTK